MFLVTATHKPIHDTFNQDNFNINVTDTESLVITIVTDSFLSHYLSDVNGFSVIESPLINEADQKKLFLSRVIYIRKEGHLSVYKPTISGRPIYHYINPQGEFYCSTHISMLKMAGVIIEENVSVLPEFFVYRYITSPKTLYKNINQLTIGSELHIELINGRCIINAEQNKTPFAGDPGNSSISAFEEQYSSRIRTDLTKALQSLNPVNDRLAVLLSGGLDSSILFAISKKTFGLNTSYSTSYPFEDAANDTEKKYATSAAEAFKSDHFHYETDTVKYIYGVVDSIKAAEEPLHHLQSVLLYLLFKNGIPENKNIVISGQGADGVFGLGLHERIHNWEKHIILYKLLAAPPLSSLINSAVRYLGRGEGLIEKLNMHQTLNTSLEDPNNIIYILGKYSNDDWVCRYFNVSREDIVENRYKAIEPYRHNSIFNLISILDLIGDVSGTQSIWSKIGERNKRILYYPFNKDQLLQNAFSMDWEYKLKEPKTILRDLARELKIPDFIINRRKAGFRIGPRKWAIKGGVFEPLIPLALKCCK